MAYEKDGIQYPSVTTILGLLDKPALISWSANCAVEYVSEHMDAMQDITDVHRGEEVLENAKKAWREKRDDSASSGTMVHKAIEAYIGGLDFGSLLQNDEAKRGFEAFLSWEKKNHVEWLESEVEVFSLKHGYAGRFDVIAKVNGFRTLIDFKTSKGIWDEMSYQLCAYRQAYNENKDNEPLENLAILHLSKETGEPTYKAIEKNIERYTKLFNSLTEAYYLMKNRRLKNNPFVKAAKTGEPVELKEIF